jgi:protein SCO1
MRSKFRNSLLAAVVVLTGCGGTDKHNLVLPVIGEKRFDGKDTIYHTVQQFTLTDQTGATVSGETVRDKIYVANFFFVSCQSICPEMSTNLRDVQAAFANDPDVLILSHSVNPLHDTVEVLQRYGGMYGANPEKWHLLTGDKKTIYDLAKQSYLVSALEDDGSPEGFIHSELFMLVDKHRRLRGMYDGTDKAQVKKLIGDIAVLKTEEKQG